MSDGVREKEDEATRAAADEEEKSTKPSLER